MGTGRTRQIDSFGPCLHARLRRRPARRPATRAGRSVVLDLVEVSKVPGLPDSDSGSGAGCPALRSGCSRNARTVGVVVLVAHGFPGRLQALAGGKAMGQAEAVGSGVGGGSWPGVGAPVGSVAGTWPGSGACGSSTWRGRTSDGSGAVASVVGGGASGVGVTGSLGVGRSRRLRSVERSRGRRVPGRGSPLRMRSRSRREHKAPNSLARSRGFRSSELSALRASSIWSTTRRSRGSRAALRSRSGGLSRLRILAAYARFWYSRACSLVMVPGRATVARYAKSPGRSTRGVAVGCGLFGFGVVVELSPGSN